MVSYACPLSSGFPNNWRSVSAADKTKLLMGDLLTLALISVQSRQQSAVLSSHDGLRAFKVHGTRQTLV